MTRYKHYLSSKIFGIKYIFDLVGDGLPNHAHGDNTAHNIVVMHGAVKVIFDDRTVYLQEGDIYDFDGTRYHSVRATEPDSCILNLFLNGQPEEYKKLPESELSGEFKLPDLF